MDQGQRYFDWDNEEGVGLWNGRVDTLRKESLSLAFLVYMEILLLLFTGEKYWKKITEIVKAGENVAVLAVEHGYPIFATKEEA